jgi:hypothetical protein
MLPGAGAMDADDGRAGPSTRAVGESADHDGLDDGGAARDRGALFGFSVTPSTWLARLTD